MSPYEVSRGRTSPKVREHLVFSQNIHRIHVNMQEHNTASNLPTFSCFLCAVAF